MNGFASWECLDSLDSPASVSIGWAGTHGSHGSRDVEVAQTLFRGKRLIISDGKLIQLSVGLGDSNGKDVAGAHARSVSGAESNE